MHLTITRKYQRMNTQPIKTKTNKNNRRLRTLKNLKNTLKTLLKLTNTRKLNKTSTTGHRTEHNYTLVNQTINICKSNKGVTK